MNEIIPLEVVNLCRCFHFWDFEFNLEKRKRIENDIISGKRRMFVYRYEGEYVAGISLSICDEDTCCISYLSVEEKHQNKGIGTALLKFACNYATEFNIKRALLEVDYGNIRAKKLYHGLGFSDDEINPQGRIRMIKHLT